MAGLIILSGLCVVMALASFLAGGLPLSMTLSPPQLRFISALGVGILVGTSLIVIIPEGIEAVMSTSLGHQSHGTRHVIRDTTAHPDTVVACDRSLQARTGCIFNREYTLDELLDIRSLHNEVEEPAVVKRDEPVLEIRANQIGCIFHRDSTQNDPACDRSLHDGMDDTHLEKKDETTLETRKFEADSPVEEKRDDAELDARTGCIFHRELPILDERGELIGKRNACVKVDSEEMKDKRVVMKREKVNLMEAREDMIGCIFQPKTKRHACDRSIHGEEAAAAKEKRLDEALENRDNSVGCIFRRFITRDAFPPACDKRKRQLQDVEPRASTVGCIFRRAFSRDLPPACDKKRDILPIESRESTASTVGCIFRRFMSRDAFPPACDKKRSLVGFKGVEERDTEAVEPRESTTSTVGCIFRRLVSREPFPPACDKKRSIKVTEKRATSPVETRDSTASTVGCIFRRLVSRDAFPPACDKKRSLGVEARDATHGCIFHPKLRRYMTEELFPRACVPLPEVYAKREEKDVKKAADKPDDAAHSHTEPRLPTFYIGFALMAGFVLMFLIDRLPRHASANLHSAPPTRHISLDNLETSSTRGDDESQGFLGSLTADTKQSRGLATTVGLVIHAAADGIAMGASATTEDMKLGFIIFFAIMIHKAPAAFGLTSVLLKQGLSKRAARGHLIVFSLAAPVGALATYLIISLIGGAGMEGESGQWWTGILLLFSAGTFLYVAMHAMQEDNGSASHDHHSDRSGTHGYSPEKLTKPQMRDTLATVVVVKSDDLVVKAEDIQEPIVKAEA